MKKQHIIVLVLFAGLILLAFIQCTEKYPAAHQKLNLASADGCVNCHLDADLLKKVATPLPPKEANAGEG